MSFKGHPFFTILMIVSVSLLSGCGANYDVELPNRHRVIVMNSSDKVISSRDYGQAVHSSIHELNTFGDIVYGSLVDSNTRLFDEYFLLDTASATTEYFDTEAELVAALRSKGFSGTPEFRRLTYFYGTASSPKKLAVVFVLLTIFIFAPLSIAFLLFRRWRSRGVVKVQEKY